MAQWQCRNSTFLATALEEMTSFIEEWGTRMRRIQFSPVVL